MTLRGLYKTAGDSLSKAKKKFRMLKIEFDTSYHESGLTEELDSDQVANISPREARIWCQLNTRDMRNKIKRSHNNPETLISLLRGVTQLPLSNNPFQDWEGAASMGSCWCYAGAPRSLARVSHPAQERSGCQIGEPLIKACHDRNESRERLECGMGSTEKEVLRVKVMTGDISSLTPQQRAIAESWRNNLIRPCKSHLGQAFKQDVKDWNSYSPVDCCYQCKELFGYDEIQGSNPGRVKKFRAGQKEENISPHSCCEVPASAYCKLNSL
ncbi:hypothetical protein EDB80DRAFT_690682 [Ilyonectria destructans]|nr:hypothetical protein EDB80DRAFT_690682 [Ilyonectria destructans]